MDQAMGDLQAQLEEMRRLWEEERVGRQRAETELDVLRGMKPDGDKKFQNSDSDQAKRRSAEAEDDEGESDSRGGKRQRVG
jgi:transcriptional regulator CBF1